MPRASSRYRNVDHDIPHARAAARVRPDREHGTHRRHHVRADLEELLPVQQPDRGGRDGGQVRAGFAEDRAVHAERDLVALREVALRADRDGDAVHPGPAAAQIGDAEAVAVGLDLEVPAADRVGREREVAGVGAADEGAGGAELEHEHPAVALEDLEAGHRSRYRRRQAGQRARQVAGSDAPSGERDPSRVGSMVPEGGPGSARGWDGWIRTGRVAPPGGGAGIAGREGGTRQLAASVGVEGGPDPTR
jgi:hypothetical protein